MPSVKLLPGKDLAFLLPQKVSIKRTVGEIRLDTGEVRGKREAGIAAGSENGAMGTIAQFSRHRGESRVPLPA